MNFKYETELDGECILHLYMKGKYYMFYLHIQLLAYLSAVVIRQ